ncbi:hypothetical protein STANM309S_06282 [Streptomyces tanashiensis]
MPWYSGVPGLPPRVRAAVCPSDGGCHASRAECSCGGGGGVRGALTLPSCQARLCGASPDGGPADAEVATASEITDASAHGEVAEHGAPRRGADRRSVRRPRRRTSTAAGPAPGGAPPPASAPPAARPAAAPPTCPAARAAWPAPAAARAGPAPRPAPRGPRPPADVRPGRCSQGSPTGCTQDGGHDGPRHGEGRVRAGGAQHHRRRRTPEAVSLPRPPLARSRPKHWREGFERHEGHYQHLMNRRPRPAPRRRRPRPRASGS